MTPTSDKHPSLTEILRGLEKQFGKGAVMRLGEQGITDIPVVPTGSLGLDVALGVGGFPRGRLIEIYGPEGSGKTTLALSAIAQAQRSGGLCAFIDAEHAVDVSYAHRLGVDVGELLVSQPDHGEQALEIVDRLCQTEAVAMIVVDSVAALIPRAELEGEIGDIHMGLQARLMSQAMRKLASVASKHGTAVVFINQLRQKIGVTFGSPETTPGGNALKFYASVRLDIRRIGHVKDGEVALGTRVRVKVVKNKVAPPFRQAEFEILFGSGVNLPAELVDLGVAYGIIEKSGSYYSLDGQRLAQGRERVVELLVSRPDLIDSVRDRVLAVARDARPAVVPSLDEGEVELVAVGAE